MARLFNRHFQISFGKDGNVDHFGQFGSVNAGSPLKTKDLDLIQALSAFATGFQDEVISSNKAPFLEDMNSLMYLLFYQLCYMFQDGVPLWNSQTTYFLGSVVNNGNNRLFMSLTDDNLNNAPPAGDSDNANWTEIYPVRTDTLRGTILTAQIEDLNVTDAKIAGMSSSKLIGGITASQISGVKRLLAHRSTDAANVTGDGTAYQVPFNVADIDTDGGFNTSTGVYTIPSGGTGLWEFSGQVSLKRSSAGTIANFYQVIVTVGGSPLYRTVPFDASIPGGNITTDPMISIPFNFKRSCLPGDQIAVTVQAVGGSKVLGLSVLTSSTTYFYAEQKI